MSEPDHHPSAPRGMLALLTTAAFVIFTQIFMIAPILPAFGEVFASTPSLVGLAVPAYLVPYGVMTLIWGPLSDRVGRRPVILASLVAFSVLTAATAFVGTATAFIGMRLVTAIGASGVVPIGLALIGDLYPYQRRGWALGWLFGGMAGGMAVGAAGGALAEPLLGWGGLFLTVSALGLVLLSTALAVLPATPRPASVPPWRKVAAGYRSLLRTARGQRTYAFVLVNAVLHSGIYTWLGVYLVDRFGLGEIGIGLTLLGYGIPGLLLGPVIGRLADRYGRARIIPAGLALGAACALLLATPLPLLAVQASIVVMSLGYDMTQPPLGGIVTDLAGNRGLAMGLNVFTLFTGMGIGSFAFQAALLPAGFPVALTVFGVAAAAAAAAAVPLFRHEQPRTSAPAS
ncbi:MFS transporter [Saccharopolyspora sp. ID03-671]|uniref:MFS transporter n=1 Tax=Saccharopolyspora sp. ID03-671 TaxID=3073066 RepID=UPI00325603C2